MHKYIFSGLYSLIQFRHLQLHAKKKRKMKKLFHQYAKSFPQMIRTIYQFPYFSMMSVFTQAVLGISREGTASKIRYLMQVSSSPVSVTIPPPGMSSGPLDFLFKNSTTGRKLFEKIPTVGTNVEEKFLVFFLQFVVIYHNFTTCNIFVTIIILFISQNVNIE